MALVSEILNRSLRLLGVIDAAEATPSLESTTAIIALNAMLMRWEANGLSLGWANVSAVSDTLPSPGEAHEAIIYNLAVRLAPEYGVPQSYPILQQQARDSLSELRRDRLAASPLVVATDLPVSGHWNIYTDSPV